MRIIITEQQLNSIKQSKGFTPEEISDSLWSAVNGLGTNESMFYEALNHIKDKSMFNEVNNLLKTKHGQDFYEIVNEFFEFESDEKEKIVNILNSKNLPNIIVDGEIKPNIIKDLNYYIENDLNFRREVVAATMIGESGGEIHPDAMKAVLLVLSNRTKGMSGKGKYMAQQALYPKQFSIWDEIPRTYKDVKSYINKQKKHPKWSEAFSLVVNPPKKDITRGAMNYYASQGTNKMSKEQKSRHKWIADLGDTVQIGSHTFGTPTP